MRGEKHLDQMRSGTLEPTPGRRKNLTEIEERPEIDPRPELPDRRAATQTESISSLRLKV